MAAPGNGVSCLPTPFIRVAEASGLIVPIGEWALTEARRQARRREHVVEDGDCFSISVNLSGRQLQGCELTSLVQCALIEAGLDASRLVLEMTESVLIERTDEA